MNLQKNDNIRIIYRVVIITLMIFTLLEAIFFPQMENLYGCGVFILSWILLYSFVLKKDRLKCFFPYFMMLGLGISFYWLPLLVTMLEGKPLTFRFENPYLTFNNQLLNLIMLICAYRLCHHLYRNNNFFHNLWAKIGYFKVPTDKQIWVLGFIGLASFLAMLRIQGSEAAEAENLGAGGQILNILREFAGLPVLLFFKDIYGGNNKKTNKLLVFVYLAFFVLIGVATGKRGTILMPFASMAMCYILPAIIYNKKLFTTRNTFLIIILFYLATGPVADLAIAMALGRDNSGQTSSSQTFDNITKIYNDKERLHTMYQAYMAMSDNGGDNNYGWSEYYVDNILLDRFCNLRVCDASLYYASKLGFDNPKMHDYFYHRLMFQFPTPILRLLGDNSNKFEYNFTPGDLLSTEGLGLTYQYMGFRVAGDTGIGLYLWGYKYYFIAFFIYFAFFYFMSTVVDWRNGRIIIPVPQALSLMGIFFAFNNATGIVGIVSTLLRGGWQDIVLYCIIFFVVRKIIR